MNNLIEKDLTEIKIHWENKNTVSLKDKNLQLLEREAIISKLSQMKPAKTIVDLGCGNGEDTLHWSQYADTVLGFDYSKHMLRSVKKKTNVQFCKLDMIQENFNFTADIVITKRSLINLGSYKNQINVIHKIHTALKKNGYFIMLECSQEGLNNLNLFRSLLNLPPIPMPHHNTFFTLSSLLSQINKWFKIEYMGNFSTYYFLSRIYNQIIDPDNYVKFDIHSKALQQKTNILESLQLGPQFLTVLKKY